MKGFGRQVRDRGKGDHDIWRNPRTGKSVTVPVKIMSRHLANKILKDAGLPKAF
jgi:predicted RNA binding protein YcfA (HicA-like mRNA interferase family)